MTTTAMTIIASIIGSFTMILLGIIAYFAKSFVSSTKAVEISVNELKAVVQTERAISRQQQTNCEKIHEQLDLTMKDYAGKLENHEVRIAVLENRD